MESPRVPLTPSRLAPLLQPLQAFLSAESAGGIILFAAALAAIVWANSPWGDGYQHFWHSQFAVSIGRQSLSMSLEHWVNDGLMALFFLLVGLEIKRELVIGELASVRRAALPVAAAIGGMVVPALIFIAINRGGPGAHGWGVPMATDIAFAVGVLALVGRSIPTSVKIFLLAVAIVDDLGAVVVIAIFYSHGIDTHALAIAGAFLAGLILLNILRVHQPLPYLLLGVGLWLATLYSGIHATIAGVLLAFTIPATRQIEELPFVQYTANLLKQFESEAHREPQKITPVQSYALKGMEVAAQGVQTPLARVEHALLKPVSFLIVPLFALANAGVDLRNSGGAAFHDPVLWGVLFGLLIGKSLGVLGASALAVRTRIAVLPEGATRMHIFGVAVLCGIGFTMSLFVTNLAFPDHAAHIAASKLGILIASLLSGLAGGGILMWASKHSRGSTV